MSNREARVIISNVIMSMDRPFNVSDLFSRLAKEGVTDRSLILDVLDCMCECELISYEEIKDDCWAFNVAKVS